MQNLENKKTVKELSKFKKTKKKLLKTLSLDKLKKISSQPLANAYQNFKKKRAEKRKPACL